jgi:SAM-dependent methyltransferase
MAPDEYRKLAEVEDSLWHFASLHEHIRRALASHLPAAVREAPAVLDAGCGTGGLLRRLARWWPRAQLTGLDFAPAAVALARERAPAARVVEGSITALPFGEREFDAIVSADVVCQVSEPGRAWAEFARCLRPGGVVVVNVPAYRWLWSYHDETCQTQHRFTRPQLVAAARAAGLQPVDATYWNALALPAIVLRRKVFARRGATSDVQTYPGWVAWPMRAAMALEHGWRRLGGRWAWGCSVLVVASKARGTAGDRGGRETTCGTGAAVA